MTSSYHGRNERKELPIKHLSASSLSAYRDCPMMFWGKYLYKWPWVNPPQIMQAMVLGIMVDKALEAFHHGQDPMAELCRRWSNVKIEMMPNAFAKALGMIRAYTADEHREPRDITQQRFSIQIPGVELPIIGYTDVERGLTVKEIKTTGSATWWTEERAKESLQGGLYAIKKSRENHGAQVPIEHHILSHRNNECTHTVFTNSPTKADQQECEQGIRDTWAEIGKGDLNAICKPGKCRYPVNCRPYGYVGTDDTELDLSGLRKKVA
jgi:hypothetical protein